MTLNFNRYIYVKFWYISI